MGVAHMTAKTDRATKRNLAQLVALFSPQDMHRNHRNPPFIERGCRLRVPLRVAASKKTGSEIARETVPEFAGLQ